MTVSAPTDAVAERAGLLLDRLRDVPRERDGWADVVAACQQLVDVVTAVQDHALVEVARRELVHDEDGALGEVEHRVGMVALDAADLVAPLLGASHGQAQRRVEAAVRVAGGREPVEVGDASSGTPTGLRRLHAAMLDGRLDGYRASVVADELVEAPAAVAAAVVDALDPDIATSDAPALRRRCRRLLARISPDLLRQRAVRARTRCGLRRWASEPGVDTWLGTFPSEQAAAAWAAVDRLAHEHVRDGVCATVEQARGRALTDLVLGHASVEVRVRLTAPAPQVGPADDLVQAQGSRPSEPVLVPRAWLADHLDPLAAPLPCHPRTGARLDPSAGLATDAYRPGARLAALVRTRDGRCRFPGCAVSARFCDLDHVRPWPGGPTRAENLLCLCRRHHPGQAVARVVGAPRPRRHRDVDRPSRSGAQHGPARCARAGRPPRARCRCVLPVSARSGASSCGSRCTATLERTREPARSARRPRGPLPRRGPSAPSPRPRLGRAGPTALLTRAGGKVRGVTGASPPAGPAPGPGRPAAAAGAHR